jgi:predicted RecB family nuclease
MAPRTAITSAVFKAFLRCETKASLLLEGAEPDHAAEFEDRWRALAEQFKASASGRLRLNVPEGELHEGLPPLAALKRGLYRVVMAPLIEVPKLSARPHALEAVRSDHATSSMPYHPVRFVLGEKVTRFDKLLVAFDALAVGRLTGSMPRVGVIIHGSGFKATRFPLPKLLGIARSVVGRIAAQSAGASPPPLVLNKHCPECAFRSRCRQIAIEKDDLSLLSAMKEQERKKQNERGIFTIHQLSYTYRPRKYSARTTSPSLKHEPALKALAIKRNRVHVLGTPHFNLPDHAVYIDVEGVPDRSLYYLVGLLYRDGDADIQRSFWAENDDDERSIWLQCINELKSLNHPQLIYYGNYESKFLKLMKARYCENEEDHAFVDELISSSFNLLSLLYGNIYFPTYSNGLKEIAGYLGFRWSEADASGLGALLKRAEWEGSRQPDLKQKLLTYNAEDCMAAQLVARVVADICAEQPPPQAVSVNVTSLERDERRRFGKLEYALPDFKPINEAAYWDYQRSKVYTRSGIPKARSPQPRRRPKLKKAPLNKIIQASQSRPNFCPKCSSSKLYINGHYSHVVYDLKFSRVGLKRWTTRFDFVRYQCWSCKNGHNELPRQDMFGDSLKAFVVYQIIELMIPQRAIARSFSKLFDLQMSPNSVNCIKASSSRRYEAAYRSIIQKIAAGPVVHADETKIMVGIETHYVWVFTSLNEVAYVYSSSRDSETIRNTLGDFKGVLISDFYAGYDTIDCAQQKCLIHLLRDINEDVLKRPFDEEMVEFAHRFAALINPIVETIDRFGLKARYLRKHKLVVRRFYNHLSNQVYQSSVAAGYKKRFERTREKLFTFLDHDGVSWNNNNAEHAIKAFARLRLIIKSNSTKGIHEFLILLSLCETCKNKEIDFLDFLRSGETNLDQFLDRPKTSTRVRRLPDTERLEPEPAATAASAPTPVVKRGPGRPRKVPGGMLDKTTS